MSAFEHVPALGTSAEYIYEYAVALGHVCMHAWTTARRARFTHRRGSKLAALLTGYRDFVTVLWRMRRVYRDGYVECFT